MGMGIIIMGIWGLLLWGYGDYYYGDGDSKRFNLVKQTEKGLTKLDLNNYCGMAIRSNVGGSNKMKKAIYAALFHVYSSEKDIYHTHCPTGVGSWCAYHLDIANKTKLHKPTKGLPEEAIKHLKPIVESLSDDSLHIKCLHGKTQNQNKSFNWLIWLIWNSKG